MRELETYKDFADNVGKSVKWLNYNVEYTGVIYRGQNGVLYLKDDTDGTGSSVFNLEGEIKKTLKVFLFEEMK